MSAEERDGTATSFPSEVDILSWFRAYNMGKPESAWYLKLEDVLEDKQYSGGKKAGIACFRYYFFLFLFFFVSPLLEIVCTLKISVSHSV